MKQFTIGNTVNCVGVGVHTGKDIHMTIKPAEVDSGIRFIRIDLDGSDEEKTIVLSPESVSHTVLCTTVSNKFGASVQTIEHMLAALWGLRIVNLVIEIDGPEVPIMDGSSEFFDLLFKSAELIRQPNDINVFVVKKSIEVSDNSGDAYIKLTPHDGFVIDYTIDYPETKLIGKQNFVFDAKIMNFSSEMLRARTFCTVQDIEKMKEAGLYPKGGSLNNAVVYDNDRVLNEGGQRYVNEAIRHKILDLIGDLMCLGLNIQGKFECFKSGHKLNSEMIKKIHKLEI